MANVRLVNVQKSFANTHVLRDINLEIRDGEFMVFVGPSGCGKSTLLRTIAGLEDITSGELSIGGKLVNDIPPSERGIAMVFQSYALYPHMDLFDNMAFGLKLANVPKDEITRLVNQAAKILHIDHLLDRKPKDLSGGQRQRVAIGRAIVRKPEVFLFDEPLSNLDTGLRVRMRYEFAKLHEEFKSTMIYVTHDQVEAMTLADRIVVLSAGTIEQVGTPLELYQHPGNIFVAGFIGSPRMNFISAEMIQADAGSATVRLQDGTHIRCRVDGARVPPGSRVTVGIRPEHFSDRLAAETDNRVDATVTFVESLGSTTYVYCVFPGVEDALTCQMSGNAVVRPAERLNLFVPQESCYLFDENGLALSRLAAPFKTKLANAPGAQ